MDSAAIQCKTTITDFLNPADEPIIRAVIEKIYVRSATAKEMLDDWISAGKTITIKFLAGKAQAYPNTGDVEIDLNYANRLLYIDNNGTALNNTVERVLIHELVHALTGRLDDGTGAGRDDRGSLTDYKGATVDYANIIYRELGYPEQNSYIGQNVLEVNGTVNVLIPGFQYTNGTAIDRSVSISNTYEPRTINYTGNWDSSHAGDSRDLLIGDGNPNKLAAGDGDDFLYGMGGNDTLDGGEGNDHLYGGDDNDKLYGLGGANYLEGGAGADEYHIVSDGKADTILDIDGWGIIELDGEILQGGTGTAPDLWKSADGAITYHLLDGTLEVIKGNRI